MEKTGFLFALNKDQNKQKNNIVQSSLNLKQNRATRDASSSKEPWNINSNIPARPTDKASAVPPLGTYTIRIPPRIKGNTDFTRSLSTTKRRVPPQELAASQEAGDANSSLPYLARRAHNGKAQTADISFNPLQAPETTRKLTELSPRQPKAKKEKRHSHSLGISSLMIDEHLTGAHEQSNQEQSHKNHKTKKLGRLISSESVQEKRSGSAHNDHQSQDGEREQTSHRTIPEGRSNPTYGGQRVSPPRARAPFREKRWQRVRGFINLDKQTYRPDLAVQDSDPEGKRFLSVSGFVRHHSPNVFIDRYSKRKNPYNVTKPVRKGIDYYDVSLSLVTNKANMNLVNMAKSLDREGKVVAPAQGLMGLFGQINKIVTSIGAMEDPEISSIFKQTNLLSVMAGITAPPPAKGSQHAIQQHVPASVTGSMQQMKHGETDKGEGTQSHPQEAENKQHQTHQGGSLGFFAKISGVSREHTDVSRHGAAHNKELFIPMHEEENSPGHLELFPKKRSLHPLTATSKKKVTFDEGVVSAEVVEDLTTN